MLKKTYLTALAVLAISLGGAASAHADNWHGNGRDNNNNGNNGRYEQRYDNNNHVDNRRFNTNNRPVRYYTPPYPAFRDNDRVVIRNYYTNYRAPRYVTAPRWHVGYSLPSYVIYQPINPVLLSRLQPIPVGYEYVQVDNNILLISDATRLVVDALTL